MLPVPVTFTSSDLGGGIAPADESPFPPELLRKLREDLLVTQSHRPQHVRESSFFGMQPWGWPMFWQAWADSNIPGPGGFPYRGATGTTTDRQYGRDLPFFWTEVELRGYRVMSRYLCETNEFAIGFLELLTDYHIGTGYGWQACLKGESKQEYAGTGAAPSNPLVAKAQRILDEFRTHNGWAQASAEAFTRWRRDGEVFGRVGCAGGNSPIWYRVIEPEQIGAPDGATNQPWSYGIDVLTYDDGRIDSQTPTAYHVWDLESGMTLGEWVDASEIVHIKANVDSTVKRGRPDFFPSQSKFDGVRRLVDGMLTTAVDQAALAWIEQFPSASAAQVAAIVPEQVTVPGTTIPTNTWSGAGNQFGFPLWNNRGSKFIPGTIYRTEGNRQITPGPTSSPEGFIAVEQAALRAIGARWRFPEYFSGDASNNNMASSIVAGSPFVVGVKRSQNTWGDKFEVPVALRVLDLAVASGRLTKAERAQLDVHVTPPAVAGPKPEEETQRRTQLVQAKIMSIPTAQLQEGLDPQHEAANMKAAEPQQPGEGPPAPGAPPDQSSDSGGDSLAGLFGESEEWVSESLYSLLSEAGRTGLVQKKITVKGKSGKEFQRTVWVKPEQPKAPGKREVKQLDAKQTLAGVQQAFKAPEKLTPEIVQTLAENMKKLTVPQLTALQKELAVKGGKDKADRVQRLLDHARAKIAAAKEPVTKEPAKPAGKTKEPAKPAGKSDAHAAYQSATPKARDALDAALFNTSGEPTVANVHKHKDQRDLATQLGQAWDQLHADPAATKNDFTSMEKAIQAMVPGIQKIGSHGEQVTFDPSNHLSPESGIFTGDRARVKVPGWTLPQGDKQHTALKATVVAKDAGKPATKPEPKPTAKEPTPTPAPAAKAELPAGHKEVGKFDGGAVVSTDPKTGDMTTTFPEGQPEKQAARLGGTIKAAMEDLLLDPDYQDGMVSLGAIVGDVKRLVPGTTDTDVLAALAHMRDTRQLEGHPLNEVQQLTDGQRHAGLRPLNAKNPATATLWQNGRAMHWWMLSRDKGATAKPATPTDKPAAPSKPAASPSAQVPVKPKPIGSGDGPSTRDKQLARAKELGIPDVHKLSPSKLAKAIADAEAKK